MRYETNFNQWDNLFLCCGVIVQFNPRSQGTWARISRCELRCLHLWGNTWNSCIQVRIVLQYIYSFVEKLRFHVAWKLIGRGQKCTIRTWHPEIKLWIFSEKRQISAWPTCPNSKIIVKDPCSIFNLTPAPVSFHCCLV